ncbi:MAG TPA: HAD-IIB family hydrolase [Nitrospira sp.]|nr:HAD-IIB family hydrolase [Nitrospira sp.]
MLRVVVFTDLDGSLLDAGSYSFAAAQEALDLLRAREAPLILASSKTRAEMEPLRAQLGNHDPFIVENGGAVFVPSESCSVPPKDSVQRGAYYVTELGTPYTTLRAALKNLVRKSGTPLRGFGDLSRQEIADLTGLTLEAAALAKEREYDEPLVIDGPPDLIERLAPLVQAKGLRLLRAGRFYHLSGATDKGAACRYLIAMYRQAAAMRGDRVLTVGIGDSLNDLPMLAEMDRPIAVQKPDGSYDPGITIPRLEFAPGPGPSGWNRAVLDILKAY